MSFFHGSETDPGEMRDATMTERSPSLVDRSRADQFGIAPAQAQMQEGDGADSVHDASSRARRRLFATSSAARPHAQELRGGTRLQKMQSKGKNGRKALSMSHVQYTAIRPADVHTGETEDGHGGAVEAWEGFDGE